MNASQLQDGRGIVHDRIDSSKLLQDLQAHTCSNTKACCSCYSASRGVRLSVDAAAEKIHASLGCCNS